MVLRRRTVASGPATAVTLLGWPTQYSPNAIAGGIQVGDANVSTMNDEIAAATWPGPPVSGDEMVIDGLVWAVLGAESIYEGVELLGFEIWVRGGR